MGYAQNARIRSGGVRDIDFKYIPSSHGFSWYLWFPSKFYLNVEEEEFLHYFTHVCNYSPFVIHQSKTIDTQHFDYNHKIPISCKLYY